MAGALVNLTRNAETIQGYQLTSSTDMMTALNYVVQSSKYTGGISCGRPGGTVVWQLTITDITAPGSSQTGGIGDWVIIENNAVASICPASDFTSLYATS